MTTLEHTAPGTRQAKDEIHSKTSAALSKSAGSQKGSGLIALSFSKLLLLFVVGSIVGLLIEVLYHLLIFGEFESRAGLVWGPFSPLYGVGAVVLTIVLNWLWQRPGSVIFLISAIIGSAVEFACSLWMEQSFGAVAWDYSGTFLNIDGRVNFMFACMWGVLGYLWVRYVMPALSRGFACINWKKPVLKITSFLLTVFLIVNITLTVQAFDRESQRAQGLPATDSYERFLDENFSSEWMAAHFENMSINGAPE